MAATHGALALRLDFGGATTAGGRHRRTGLRLASPGGPLPGPEKYKVLEHRRRQAQIKARRLLDLQG